MRNYNETKTPKVIKFNWELVKQYTNRDALLMLEFFDNVYVRKSENYFYLNPWAAKIVAESRDNAHNYIENIPEFIDGAKYATNSEILVYLDLASKRSYFDFINTKGKLNYLPMWKINGYDVDALKRNRLLTFDEQNIYLLYEKDNI